MSANDASRSAGPSSALPISTVMSCKERNSAMLDIITLVCGASGELKVRMHGNRAAVTHEHGQDSGAQAWEGTVPPWSSRADAYVPAGLRGQIPHQRLSHRSNAHQ